MKRVFLTVLLLTTTTVFASDNPMWRQSLEWTCSYSSLIRCERSTDCTSRPETGTLKVDYRNNNVVDQAGLRQTIKRHYVQAIAGSPIGSEVKIELATNDVIWLSAADAGGIFSDNWTGAMVSQGAGVILQTLRPLICVPVH